MPSSVDPAKIPTKPFTIQPTPSITAPVTISPTFGPRSRRGGSAVTGVYGE
ncbi:hypothetical protein [Sandaracinus amylolyticus]|uniref:hypothetical protein n=1 Tax=Sandaracinus amylolyticus TaxID=927083 RepID=UPI0012EDAE45|nr:hypothetical protein [Sandaracinus amylolyticus]